MTICAIHQPNFFPWAGYFDKINKADIFIFLDEVNYPKSGSGSGSWCNRVKLMSSGAPAWYGLPVERVSGNQPIKEVQFSNKPYQIGKLLKSLEHNYKKHPNFEKFKECFYPILTYSSNNLSDYNINAIMTIASYLNIKNTKFIRQSELVHNTSSTELLIELIQAVGADTYLCGNGCGGYQDDALFESFKITLQYQNYAFQHDEIFDLQNTVEGALSVLNHLILQK